MEVREREGLALRLRGLCDCRAGMRCRRESYIADECLTCGISSRTGLSTSRSSIACATLSIVKSNVFFFSKETDLSFLRDLRV